MLGQDELLTGNHGWDAEGANWKGRSFVATESLQNTSTLAALAEHIWNSESRQYVELKPLGGAIREVDKHATAFWHREVCHCPASPVRASA